MRALVSPEERGEPNAFCHFGFFVFLKRNFIATST